MNIILRLFLFVSFSFLPTMVWAGGAVDAIRQRQIMEQKAAIEQELVRRQQQEMIQQYTAAYQQAAIQQYVAAQRDAMAMRAAQEQVAAHFMAQRMAEEMTAYQIIAARRDQMLAQQAVLQIKVMQGAQQQAYQYVQAQQYAQKAAAEQMVVLQQQKSLAEYQQALLAKEILTKAANDQIQQVYAVKTVQEVQQGMAYKAAAESMNKDRLYEDIPSSYVKDVVLVSDLWKSLDKSSKAWPLMIDKKAKGVTVSHYIQKLAEEGGKIRKDPMFYVDMLEGMSKENRSMLLQPIMDLIRIMAIIEYDYDNGIDKDALARRIFPDEKSFLNNKKRLGI